MPMQSSVRIGWKMYLTGFHNVNDMRNTWTHKTHSIPYTVSKGITASQII